MFFASLFLLLSTSLLASAAPHGHVGETVPRSLPGLWFQPEDHPVHALFRRDGEGNFPAVGSPEWSQGFPVPGKPLDPTMMPSTWLDALNDAVAAGKIPNIPIGTPNANGPTTYGSSNGGKQPVCSAAYGCRIEGQLWDAPQNTIGISFDDGPLPGSSDMLYAFLQKNDIPSTHFFIGVNIIMNPKEFTAAFATLGADIAVHTWTHPHMTTLSSEQVVAELGWTAQLIYNSTGGRVPRFWRPPYGDTDARVTAIAQEVFGLTTVVWNHDTADWTLTTGANITSVPKIVAEFGQWLTGPRTPGLIVLEHELSNQSVTAFMDSYPLMVQNKWNIVSVASIGGNGTYQNAANSTAPVFAQLNITGGEFGNAASSSASSASMTAADASATSSSGSNSGNSSHSGATPLHHAPLVMMLAGVIGSILVSA